MKRLFVCLLFTAFLPLAASTTQSSSTNLTPFSTVAFAGHTSQGGWCECGSQGCTCDPGESPNNISRQGSTNNSEPPDEPITDPDPDLGSIVLILAFMAMALFRLRA